MKKIHIPKVRDKADLLYMEALKDIPFEIKRVFIIKNIRQGSIRGDHANKKNKEVVFCIQGEVRIYLHNGKDHEYFTLSKPSEGLLVPNNIWIRLDHFSEDAILMVMCSELYDSKDYIYELGDFLASQI